MQERRQWSVLGLLGALVISGCWRTVPCTERPDEPLCATIDASSDGSMPLDATDDSPDAGPCGRACPVEAPLCDEATGECVACLSNLDCTEATASQCVEGACTGCDASDDCEHLASTPVCDASECVECTIATEEGRCGVTSCDPATRACTGTPRGTVQRCGACRADSECRDASDRCVPMTFMGESRPGGYCLKTTEGGCEQPFSIALSGRTSLSGEGGHAYCGINETLTTCEAVRALLNNVACPTGSECPEGGFCRTVGVLANRCSFACAAASECLAAPTAGSTCGPGTPPSGTNYCGG